MQGYQLTFFTQQDRKHGHQPMGEWLLEEARKIGIAGARLIGAEEGFGPSHKLHSYHFFELADQPIEVVLAVSEEDATRLFERLHEEKIDIFYVKAPIEFGMTGKV